MPSLFAKKQFIHGNAINDSGKISLIKSIYYARKAALNYKLRAPLNVHFAFPAIQEASCNDNGDGHFPRPKLTAADQKPVARLYERIKFMPGSFGKIKVFLSGWNKNKHPSSGTIFV